MTITKTGKWDEYAQALEQASEIEQALTKAMLQEAELLRSIMVKGITSGSPGGRRFRRLAPSTLATRMFRRGPRAGSGRKALMVTGGLRNSISVIQKKTGIFIGVPKRARSRTSSGRFGTSLVKIAALHEFGSRPMVITITPRMRRFLAMLARAQGRPPGGGSGRGFVVVRIPARPFVRPSFGWWRKGLERRFLNRMRELLPAYEVTM